MTTKLIGIKEYRQNLAEYTQLASGGKIRLIILRKNVPICEIKAVNEKEFVLGKLRAEIAEAREQVKRGEVYTQEQIMKEFGLL